jgi:HD-like signal output (HDOD) protein
VFRALMHAVFGRGLRKATVGGAIAGADSVNGSAASLHPERSTRTRQENPPRSVSSRDLDRQLWEQIRVEAEALNDTWGDEQASEDAQELLYLIVQSHRTLIQQPPAAAQAVLKLLGRRNYGQADVTRLIERDPALSQSLLRHSNSVFYSTKHSEPVVSIKSAVQRIGGTGVHATVMGQVVRGQLSRPGAVFDRMVSMAWEHMVAVAPIARSLARAFHVDGESAFTLGLLHDIGKLVFFSEVAALRKRKRREVRLSPYFVKSALERLHEPLGGIAAMQWGLDASSSWVISHHHRRGMSETPDRLTELMFVAECADLACRAGRAMDLNAVWESGGITVDIDGARGPLDACGALGGIDVDDRIEADPDSDLQADPPTEVVQELRPAV